MSSTPRGKIRFCFLTPVALAASMITGVVGAAAAPLLLADARTSPGAVVGSRTALAAPAHAIAAYALPAATTSSRPQVSGAGFSHLAGTLAPLDTGTLAFRHPTPLLPGTQTGAAQVAQPAPSSGAASLSRPVAAPSAAPAAPSSGPAAPEAGSQGVQGLARRIVPADQWASFAEIISHESSWNPRAVNTSSGAYGLGQALPASKMAAVGADWRTNPVTQIKWALDYMDSRYGSPKAAWAFWSLHHWY